MRIIFPQNFAIFVLRRFSSASAAPKKRRARRAKRPKVIFHTHFPEQNWTLREQRREKFGKFESKGQIIPVKLLLFIASTNWDWFVDSGKGEICACSALYEHTEVDRRQEESFLNEKSLRERENVTRSTWRRQVKLCVGNFTITFYWDVWMPAEDEKNLLFIERSRRYDDQFTFSRQARGESLCSEILEFEPRNEIQTSGHKN